jgi:hypothetical protein
MALVAIFDVPGMTAEQYDQTVRELEKAGLGNPDGRLYHVAASKDGGWLVVDVWESEEKFGGFGESLMPILQAEGVPPAEPQIYPVHNTISG